MPPAIGPQVLKRWSVSPLRASHISVDDAIQSGRSWIAVRRNVETSKRRNVETSKRRNGHQDAETIAAMFRLGPSSENEEDTCGSAARLRMQLSGNRPETPSHILQIGWRSSLSRTAAENANGHAAGHAAHRNLPRLNERRKVCAASPRHGVLCSGTFPREFELVRTPVTIRSGATSKRS
jgi:hypothetical protein